MLKQFVTLIDFYIVCHQSGVRHCVSSSIFLCLGPFLCVSNLLILTMVQSILQVELARSLFL